jgi:hypothetical protein
VRARTEKGVLGGLITTTTEIDYFTGLVTRTDAENRVSRFYHDKAWRLDKQELPGASPAAHPLATLRLRRRQPADERDQRQRR